MIDREVSFGYEGALYTEVKAALAGGAGGLKIINFIAGLSGRDITKENIATMYRKVAASSAGQAEQEVQFVALRWEQW